MTNGEASVQASTQEGVKINIGEQLNMYCTLVRAPVRVCRQMELRLQLSPVLKLGAAQRLINDHTIQYSDSTGRCVRCAGDTSTLHARLALPQIAKHRFGARRRKVDYVDPVARTLFA